MREPAGDKFLIPLTDWFGAVLSSDPAREKGSTAKSKSLPSICSIGSMVSIDLPMKVCLLLASEHLPLFIFVDSDRVGGGRVLVSTQ